jgi:hypothetical protein
VLVEHAGVPRWSLRRLQSNVDRVLVAHPATDLQRQWFLAGHNGMLGEHTGLPQRKLRRLQSDVDAVFVRHAAADV